MLKDEIETVLEEFHDFILEIKDAPAIEYNDAVNKQISQTLTRILELVEKEKGDTIFINHIQSHLKEGQEVICKICGKTAKEIINERNKN